jgi:hypothetical protein
MRVYEKGSKKAGVSVSVCVCVCAKREREREREKEREREREKEKEREWVSDRARFRERDSSMIIFMVSSSYCSPFSSLGYKRTFCIYYGNDHANFKKRGPIGQ